MPTRSVWGSVCKKPWAVFSAFTASFIAKWESSNTNATNRSGIERFSDMPLPEVTSLDGMSEKRSIPDRFVALVFDDSHFAMKDAVNAEKTAHGFLQTLPQTDRVGIFSTSGQVTQEFTDSPETLQKVVSSIMPRPLALNNDRDCPNVTYSLADRIVNGSDSQSRDAVVYETLQCAFGGDSKKLRYA